MALGVLLQSAAPVSAQRYTYQQYGPSDGLTNLGVTSLLQDRTGYLWIGTDNGLFRYDGHGFEPFGHEDGLSTNEIRALALAPDGTLWVATQNGVAYADEGSFHPVDTGVKGLYLSVAINLKGEIYVENTQGILRGQKDAAGLYRFQSVVQGDVTGLYISGEEILFQRGGELWIMHGDTPEATGTMHGLPRDRWGAILQDSNGNLWVRSTTRLYERPANEQGFKDRSEGIPHGMVSRLFADTHGRTYVSGNDGVTVFDGDKRIKIDPAHGLPADVASSVLIDRDETLWIGMRGGGLIRRLGQGEWSSWTKQDGLPNENVWSVLHDSRDRLWVGTGVGLSILGPDGALLQKGAAKNGSTSDSVYALTATSEGDVFAGTAPAGVLHFDHDGKVLHRYGASSGLQMQQVNSLAIDRDRYLWVAGSGGFFRSQTPIRAQSELHFKRIQVPGIPDNAYFHAVSFDSHGNLWLTSSSGLARYDGKAWSLLTEKEGLLSSDISAMVVHGEEVWIGYRDSLGIARIRWSGAGHAEVANFSERDGLSSNLAYAMVFDRTDRLWVSTDNGVNLLEGGHWLRFGTEQGVIWDDGDDQAIAADGTGNVWIGTSHGLSRYSPFSYALANKPAAIVITSIESGAARFTSKDQPTLSYAEDSLQIGFSSFDFTIGNRARYRYRLLGRKTEWTETHEGSVHFESLPGGSYAFEVIAAGENGFWSAVPARFAFRVKYPWWQRWWFLLACLLTIFFLAWGLWWFRVRTLTRQKQRLEKLVEERTAELQESHRKLLEIAYFDVLTGLPNRRMFAEQFRTRQALSARNGSSFALLLIDLDGFKEINDSHGHDIGDAVLTHCAQLLQNAVRESDSVARLGGDEFAVLLADPSNPAGIEIVCQRILTNLATPTNIGGKELSIHCSLGAAAFPVDGGDQETLYKAADIALYEAKHDGGGKSRHYSQQLA